MVKYGCHTEFADFGYFNGKTDPETETRVLGHEKPNPKFHNLQTLFRRQTSLIPYLVRLRRLFMHPTEQTKEQTTLNFEQDMHSNDL